MNDFDIWNYTRMARSYSDESSKQDLMDISLQLTDFLNSNRLLKQEVPREIWHNEPSFGIKFSDLTEEGKLVIKDGLDRWLRSIDDNRKPVNVKSLERTLHKFRKKHA